MIEGGLGKAKGLLQILWEWGSIDPHKCTGSRHDKIAGSVAITSFHTVIGQKDPQLGQPLEFPPL